MDWGHAAGKTYEKWHWHWIPRFALRNPLEYRSSSTHRYFISVQVWSDFGLVSRTSLPIPLYALLFNSILILHLVHRIRQRIIPASSLWSCNTSAFFSLMLCPLVAHAATGHRTGNILRRRHPARYSWSLKTLATRWFRTSRDDFYFWLMAMLAMVY